MVARREQLRMAAIVFARLDREQADALLARMSPAQAHRVRQAVVELNDVSEDEAEAAFEALANERSPTVERRRSNTANLDGAGIELDDRVARRLAATVRDEAVFDESVAWSGAARVVADLPGRDEPPFRFLHEARMDKLADRLGREHPQAIAVVLAHLPPSRAAEALAALAEPVQVEVLRRLAAMEPTDAVVLREIEDALRQWIAPAADASPPSVGLTAAQRILSVASDSAQRRLLDALAQRDGTLAQRLGHGGNVPHQATTSAGPLPEVASPPGGYTLRFADLEMLADSELAALWRGIDPAVAVLALAAASPEFVDRVLNGMDDSRAREICRGLDELGPVSLADFDAAQDVVTAAWHAMQAPAAGGVA